MTTIRQPLDFYGVNYYNPMRIAATEEDSEMPFEFREVLGYPKTDFGWPVVPDALREWLIMFRARFRAALPPIMITESGCSYNMEPDENGVVDDQPRIDYLESHLSAVATAIQRGVDVRGYYCWSLMDNFEWAEGYTQRFGLVHVDFETQKRTPKRSFDWYRQFIAGPDASASTERTRSRRATLVDGRRAASRSRKTCCPASVGVEVDRPLGCRPCPRASAASSSWWAPGAAVRRPWRARCRRWACTSRRRRCGPTRPTRGVRGVEVGRRPPPPSCCSGATSRSPTPGRSAWFETGKASASGITRARLTDWLGPQFKEPGSPSWARSRPSTSWCIKDPRLAWFLGLWKSAALRCDAQPSYVTMLRHVTEVVGSKKRYYAPGQTGARSARSSAPRPGST